MIHCSRRIRKIMGVAVRFRMGYTVFLSSVGSIVAAVLTFGTGYLVTAAEPVDVEPQPLAAHVDRLLDALDLLGSPLPKDATAELRAATRARDGRKLQELLDPRIVAMVTVNPGDAVQVVRGSAPSTLQQGGYVPLLAKVINENGVRKKLKAWSPQAGPVYARGEPPVAQSFANRFLDFEICSRQPILRHGGAGLVRLHQRHGH